MSIENKTHKYIGVSGSSLREPQALDRLLLPSWLSLVVTVVLSLMVVVSAVVTVNYQKSSLPLLVQYQEEKKAITQPGQPYQTSTDELPANTLISNLPLFIFWAGIGMIVYAFATNSIKTLSNAHDFRRTLDYVHADRRSLLQAAEKRLLMRAGVLVLWFFYLQFSKHIVLPYSLALAHVSAGPVSFIMNVGYFIWATALLVLCLHLHTVLLRSLLLRPRLFEVV